MRADSRVGSFGNQIDSEFRRIPEFALNGGLTVISKDIGIIDNAGACRWFRPLREVVGQDLHGLPSRHRQSVFLWEVLESCRPRWSTGNNRSKRIEPRELGAAPPEHKILDRRERNSASKDRVVHDETSQSGTTTTEGNLHLIFLNVNWR